MAISQSSEGWPPFILDVFPPFKNNPWANSPFFLKNHKNKAIIRTDWVCLHILSSKQVKGVVIGLSEQYVGFLIQKHLYQNLKKGGQAPKSILIQEEAARENNLIPCYFPFKHLSAGRDKVLAIVSKNGIYQEKIIQVPRVIYNREWSTSGRDRKIKSLTKKGVMIFNEGNYLKKYKFQALLEKKEEFSRHLPETKIANA
jgi:hypothetical protein